MSHVRVVADIYEQASGVPRHLDGHHGVTVEIERLVTGDYDVTDIGVDARDSASWLARLAHRRQKPTFRDRPVYAQRPKRTATIPPAEAALASIPSFSHAVARSLLDRFGSLAAVIDADEVAWREVRGIGPRRARALTETFYSQHGTSHSSPREEWQRAHPAT